MRLLCRQNGALRLVCAVVAFVAFANRIASAQEGFVQPAGTWTTPAPTASAPTWQDFNELAARLEATEARLQAMNAYTTAAVVDTNSAYQPNTPSLAAETQTPERTADILRRLGTLESQYSADKAKLPSVRVTGFAQLDYGAFSQDAASLANLGDIQDGVGFRRARIQAVGNLSEFTRYSFEMDFAVPGRPSFMDVWGEQTNVPWFGNVRIGHFRQPTTMDSWTSIRHMEFLERSLPFQAMDPFRRVGIMSWYNMGEDDRTLIAYSVYGTGFSFANSGGVTPTNGTLGDTRFATQIGDIGGVSAALRGTHLLYWDPYAGDRYLLHIGGGYNYSQIGGANNGPLTAANTDARTYQARAIPEFFVGDPAGGVFGGQSSAAGTPFVVDSGRFLANDFQFFHTELGGNYGPAHFQTEYMATLIDQVAGPQVFYHGAYVQCGYFLTGENCGYNKQMGALDYNVKPFREFFGLGRDQWFCGWGAWEIAARYSYVNLASTNVVNPVVNNINLPHTPNAGIVNDATLALNWWWNQYTRVQFNYINVSQNPNVGATGITNIYAARFQFEF
jgi:phosphate-selective porin OprO/OprP